MNNGSVNNQTDGIVLNNSPKKHIIKLHLNSMMRAQIYGSGERVSTGLSRIDGVEGWDSD